MQQRGYTLLQLLFVTLIASLMGLIGIPSLFSMVQKEKGTAAANQIIGILNYSRSHAIAKHVPIVICPSLDGFECTKNWGNKLLIYRDINFNFVFDNSDDMRLKHVSLPVDWSIHWRAFGNRKYIYYTAGSGEFNQNGTLELCPPKPMNTITTIVINRVGRIRTHTRPREESKCL